MSHAEQLISSRAQQARWQRHYIAQVPPKADPDVTRLVAGLRLSYGNAKMLKALSFGVPVDTELLAWCLNRDARPANVISRLRKSHPQIVIETVANNHCYIIRDLRSLSALRRIMQDEKP